MSRPHDVACPRCARRARWEVAFESVPKRGGRPVPDDDPRPVHQWGGWFLRERFPSVMPWRPPAGRGSAYFVQGEFGVVRCPECHLVAPMRLCWPEQAYFQWRLRGARLWAWNGEHARVLLHYVGTGLRDPWLYAGEYAHSLQKVPSEFLAARNRERVSRLIAARLREAGVATTLPDAALRPRSRDG